MKFEKLFESKNHKLFKTDGTEVPVTKDLICGVKWSEIEAAEEEYNEEFLAKLRDSLKELEDKDKYVFIEVAYDKTGATPGQYNNAVKHLARRLKDCKAVIGLALVKQVADDEDVRTDFFEKITEKHPHYVYFAKSACTDDVVIY